MKINFRKTKGKTGIPEKHKIQSEPAFPANVVAEVFFQINFFSKNPVNRRAAATHGSIQSSIFI